MANVITMKNLQAVVDRINTVTGSPPEQYTKNEGGKIIANIGNYHLSGAYGGYALHRICTPGGGITDISKSGHISKRALYDLIHAYLAGYEAGKEA